MTIRRRGRRHFLLGAGGFVLAIPFLPSLAPSRARAAGPERPKNFVALTTQHGGVWHRFMYPDTSGMEQHSLYPDHVVRRADLRATVSDGRAVISPVLSASSSVLTDRIVSKMNVIAGLDIPFYINHHTGGHLGNFARSNSETGDGGAEFRARVGGYIPTIDQVMAWSPRFYTTPPAARSMQIGASPNGHSISYDYSSPSTRSGTVTAKPYATSSSALFDRVFGAFSRPDPEPDAPSRVSVVSRIRESYNQLLTGAHGDASRLSMLDRRRLQEHVDRIHEIEDAVDNIDPLACDPAEPPRVDNDNYGRYANLTETERYHRVHNDIVVAALSCGASRIAAIGAEELWADYSGDWHNDIAHQCIGAEQTANQQRVWEAQQRFFERGFLDLVTKLDAVRSEDGSSLLDDTLVQWTQESGMETHESRSIPLVTAGGAGGAMRTGSFIDYINRDFSMPGGWELRPHAGLMRPGLLYNQWLATALQMMGVPPEEFERDGLRGYGSQYMYPDWSGGEATRQWPDRLRRDASAVLPFLAA